MKWLLLLSIAIVTLLLPACSTAGGGLAGSNYQRPGEGVDVRMGRATWETGWFQAEVFKTLLEELGYEVREPIEVLDNLPFYFFAAQGDIDFWPNGWFPIHDRYMRYQKVSENVEPVGFQVKNGALQGYMIDKATADELGITNLADLADRDIVAHFDHDDDGKADLIGCNTGWGCEIFIDNHLTEYGLDPFVSHVQGDYSELMQETVARFQDGSSVLFYTWTPNWTISEMVPGEDVIWLSVPYSSLPGENFADTAVESIPGCPESPCDLGFEPNDIRIVANKNFLEENNAAAWLFELAEIPMEDIASQNVRMNSGENSPEDIRRHAREWVEANRAIVDPWLEAARTVAQSQ